MIALSHPWKIILICGQIFKHNKSLCLMNSWIVLIKPMIVLFLWNLKVKCWFSKKKKKGRGLERESIVYDRCKICLSLRFCFDQIFVCKYHQNYSGGCQSNIYKLQPKQIWNKGFQKDTDHLPQALGHTHVRCKPQIL